MGLKFLGRGSAFNTKEGNTSAYYKKGNSLLLIDCGESIFQKIKESNLLDGIDNVYILITHLHSDHAGSLSSLVMYCYYCKNIIPNIFYGEAKSLSIFLDSTGATIYKHWEYLSLFRAEDELGIKINYFENKHVKEISCYGYIITIDNKPIIYTGDCYEIPQFIIEHIQTIDRIYTDTCLADYEDNVHMSLRKLCETIESKYRNKVWCMHIDCDELIPKIKENGFNIVEIERQKI